MTTQGLIKHELIETLCAKRETFIELMAQQVRLTKSMYDLCSNMDDLIPVHPLANYDYLDIVFINFRAATGEHGKHLMPKDVNLLSMSEKDCSALFTRILDQNLWSILFNRLNINSLLSTRARAEFRQQLKDDPLPFTTDNVQSTLLDILSRQDDLLLTGLIDSIQIADRTYVCNDGFKFNKAICILGLEIYSSLVFSIH